MGCWPNIYHYFYTDNQVKKINPHEPSVKRTAEAIGIGIAPLSISKKYVNSTTLHLIGTIIFNRQGEAIFKKKFKAAQIVLSFLTK